MEQEQERIDYIIKGLTENGVSIKSKKSYYEYNLDCKCKHCKEKFTFKFHIIDLINKEKLNFNRGNIYKYISRLGKKGGQLDEIKDLDKIIYYASLEKNNILEEIRGNNGKKDTCNKI